MVRFYRRCGHQLLSPPPLRRLTKKTRIRDRLSANGWFFSRCYPEFVFLPVERGHTTRSTARGTVAGSGLEGGVGEGLAFFFTNPIRERDFGVCCETGVLFSSCCAVDSSGPVAQNWYLTKALCAGSLRCRRKLAATKTQRSRF